MILLLFYGCWLGVLLRVIIWLDMLSLLTHLTKLHIVLVCKVKCCELEIELHDRVYACLIVIHFCYVSIIILYWPMTLPVHCYFFVLILQDLFFLLCAKHISVTVLRPGLWFSPYSNSKGELHHSSYHKFFTCFSGPFFGLRYYFCFGVASPFW